MYNITPEYSPAGDFGDLMNGFSEGGQEDIENAFNRIGINLSLQQMRERISVISRKGMVEFYIDFGGKNELLFYSTSKRIEYI